MKPFMDADFLLSSEAARVLYHEAAFPEPVFDYHCHLDPRDIAEDRRFDNLAAVWLEGDHYKWRALRANGVDERFVTGGAGPYERFAAWAETVPALAGNPLYHWTHLELRRYFGIEEPLNGKSAPAIWKAANEKLRSDPGLSVLGILKRFNVYALGTTDDPADSLEWHAKIRAGGKTGTKVIPSFRPDRALNIDAPDFVRYMERLGGAAGKKIVLAGDLLEVLGERIDFFDGMGCRSSDHGLEYMPWRAGGDGCLRIGAKVDRAVWEREAEACFRAAMSGVVPGRAEAEVWRSYLLAFLAARYAEKGWAMQAHIGAFRSINSRALELLGPDTGYDAAHDHPVSAKLACFLDYLQRRDELPRMIFYSLNPKDFYPLATVAGSFQGGAGGSAVPGGMRLGAGWWFLDHIDGMEEQMRVLAATGLLSRFIGMLTDSRSFLSYPRHEYFRRVLCRFVGNWIENGEVPHDLDLFGGMIKDISFRNAKRYFEG